MSVNDEDRYRSEDPAGDRGERPRRRDDDDDLDHDDYEDRRRRIRRPEGDATGGLIPYKNPMALAAYYCGVLGSIFCVIPLGFLGILPVIFGFKALKHARLHPEARGQVHAIIGIMCGFVEILTFLLWLAFFVMILAAKK